jgi:hypothetical protein
MRHHGQADLLPDGSRGYNISCDGVTSSSGDCYQSAGETCGAKGYTIVNPPGMTSTRDMFIKCKE